MVVCQDALLLSKAEQQQQQQSRLRSIYNGSPVPLIHRVGRRCEADIVRDSTGHWVSAGTDDNGITPRH